MSSFFKDLFTCCNPTSRKKEDEDQEYPRTDDTGDEDDEDTLRKASNMYRESLESYSPSKNIQKGSQQKQQQQYRGDIKKPKDGETPGGREEKVNFNHVYYEKSIKIIDLILLDKQNLIQKNNLLMEITISNVFQQVPLEYENFLQKQLNKKHEQEWRKQMEWKKYLEIKKLGNDSEYLYLIDANWVKMWLNFLLYQKADLPGQIVNEELFRKIEQKQTLVIGDDIIILSQNIWNRLFQWYGGGPILKWKIDFNDDSSARQSLVTPIKNSKNNNLAINREEQKEDLKKQNSMAYNSQERVRKSSSSSSQLNSKQNPDRNEYSKSEFIPKSKNLYKPNYKKEEEEYGTQKPYDDSERDSETKLFKHLEVRDKKLRIFGLENNSRFCYLNSVLQCLFAISEFRDFYELDQYLDVKAENPLLRGKEFSNFLKGFTEEVNRPTQKNNFKVLKTTKLQLLIRKEKKFSPVRNQDSHEFLLYLLNNLKDELTEKGIRFEYDSEMELNTLWNKYITTYPSFVDSHFTTIEKTIITCSSCSKNSGSLQFHMCIPLQVEGIKTIKQSILLNSIEEEVNDYKCEHCDKKQRCKVSRRLIKLPEVFIFQLQRFSTIPKLRKIRGLIRFEEYLSMDEFIDKENSDQQCNQPLLYQLVAVLVHLGSINGGHYIAYTKKEDGAWYSMDDDRVGKVSIEEVLQQDAYILFYKRMRE